MKLYATDFDGTLNNRPIDAVLLGAITAWRTAGNLFGIVSGRPYVSIKSEIDKYGIPYDFLIANNGAVIMDGVGNTIETTVFAPDDITALLDSFSCHVHPYMRVDTPEGYREYFGIPGYSMTEDGHGVILGGTVFSSVTEIAVSYPDYEITKSEGEETLAAVGDGVSAMISSPFGIDWIPGGINKADGIRHLIEKLGITPEKIITTGDCLNDLAMLTADGFEGYAVENGMPELKERVGRVISCPYEILTKM